MTRDELIEWLESSLERKEKVPDMACYNGYRKTLKAFEIALAVLKADKIGLLHCGEIKENISIPIGGYGSCCENYDIFIPVKTELDEILKELE
jgi:hypothetical protein